MNVRIDLTIQDVLDAGGVAQAIEKYCAADPYLAHGKTFNGTMTNINQHAVVAIRSGALAYVDSADGRAMQAGVVGWSTDSVVRLECPTIREAAAEPATAAQMAQAVLEHHSARSDVREWARLLSQIDEMTNEFRSISLADFAELSARR